MRRRYKYVKGKKEEKRLRFFWMGKTKRAKESVEKYMNGKINWYDFYNLDGFNKVKNLCSCGVLWKNMKKLKDLGLIESVQKSS